MANNPECAQKHSDIGHEDDAALRTADVTRRLAIKKLEKLYENVGQKNSFKIEFGADRELLKEQLKEQRRLKKKEQRQKQRQEHIVRIINGAQKHFGRPVVGYDAPGGEDRGSFRLYFDDTSIIATTRKDRWKIELESQVLSRMSLFSTDCPEFLGVCDSILFQSDLGDRRLSQEILKVEGDQRSHLAQEAVSSIFRLQSAARKASLQDAIPQGMLGPAWIKKHVDSLDVFRHLDNWNSRLLERNRLCEMLTHSNPQFVRGDCRSGNAIIRPQDTVAWFDFEDAHTGHGAEDIAYLIGDEVWPLPPEEMEEIVKDGVALESAQALDSYLNYLAIFLTFRCIQRLQLILRVVGKAGWQPLSGIYQRDRLGVNPECVKHICEVGAYYAARHSETVPIGRDFEEVVKRFL